MIIEKTINITTGEEYITEREETPEEVSAKQLQIAEYAKMQVDAEARAEAKAELLARLGISDEEARLVLSR